jgi:hypothetical protein
VRLNGRRASDHQPKPHFFGEQVPTYFLSTIHFPEFLHEGRVLRFSLKIEAWLTETKALGFRAAPKLASYS